MDGGRPPGSWDQTRARTFARAVSIRFIAAGVTSSRDRHTVGADATDPRTSTWWRRDVDVSDGLCTAGDQDRDVDQDPPLVAGRGEPTPTEGTGQGDLVGQ